MATLYRKYRPRSFAEVFGQHHIKVTLEHELATGKLAHAYLFCGPRAIGKTTLARILAKAVNCLNRKPGAAEPCNACDHCEQANAGRSLDIIEIDAASHTQVDHAREHIVNAARIAPVSGAFKVFIIDEAHMLSAVSFNALLKTLEEPPANVLFILCTTEVHKMPLTIVSRCQRFDFKRLTVADIVKKLAHIAAAENITVAEPILASVARHVDGHMRDAESLFGQLVAIGGTEITQAEADLVIPRSDLKEALTLIDLVLKRDPGAAITLVNRLLDEGVSLKRFITDTVELLRKTLLLKLAPSLADRYGVSLGEQTELQLSALAKNTTVAVLASVIDKFTAAHDDMRSSFIPQLPLELAIAELSLLPGPAPAVPGTTAPAAAPASRQTVINTAGLSREEIVARWQEVLARVKAKNHSLSLILRVCKPHTVQGSQLCLAFKYKFHRDRISEVQIRQIVETVLKDVYGQPITIEAIVDESLQIENGDGNGHPPPPGTPPEPGAPAGADGGQDMLNDLLKTFGGKVIS